MTCQPSSTSYRNPKDPIGKMILPVRNENKNNFEDQFTDSMISNPLFDELFPDFDDKEKYDFTIETNEGKRGGSRVRAREEEPNLDHMHTTKKRKVINNASDMLLEVRESYAYVQGADMYNDTPQPFYNTSQNNRDLDKNQSSNGSAKQETDLNYGFGLNDKWEPSEESSTLDMDKCSSNQSRPCCSPDESEVCPKNPPPSPEKTPTSYQNFECQNNNFSPSTSFHSQTSNFKVDKIFDSQPDSNSPEKTYPPLYPESNMCHLLHNRSPGFLTHPLYNLLKDIIIADMNFQNPSFPFDLILHLPETFERLLHNYFTRNPGISLANVHPIAHSILLNSLREAHVCLISKIQTRKVSEGIPILSQRHLNRKQTAQLNSYLFVNDNFNSSCKMTNNTNNTLQDQNKMNNNTLNNNNFSNNDTFSGINNNIINNINNNNNTLNNNLIINVGNANNDVKPNISMSNNMNNLNHNATNISGTNNASINGNFNGNITMNGNINAYDQSYPPRLKMENVNDPFNNLNNNLNHPLNKNNTLNSNLNIPLNSNNHMLNNTSLDGPSIHSPNNPMNLNRNHLLANPHHLIHQPMHPYPSYKNIFSPYPPDRFNSAMPTHPSHPQIIPPYHMNCNPANPFPNRIMMMMEADRRGNNSPRKYNRMVGKHPDDNPGEKTGKNKVLPKEAVNKMMEWLKEHEENPYPNDDQKEALIAETKLSINQINYWFTNARRRVLPKWAHQKQLEEQERLRNIAKNSNGSSGSSGGSIGSDGGGFNSGGENNSGLINTNNGNNDKLKV